MSGRLRHCVAKGWVDLGLSCLLPWWSGHCPESPLESADRSVSQRGLLKRSDVGGNQRAGFPAPLEYRQRIAKGFQGFEIGGVPILERDANGRSGVVFTRAGLLVELTLYSYCEHIIHKFLSYRNL